MQTPAAAFARRLLVLLAAVIACAVLAPGCAPDGADGSLDPNEIASGTEEITGCGRPTEIVVYTQDGWDELASAFAADPSPCAHYYVSMPAPVADKTYPRGPQAPADLRAHGSRIHAMAEFHWGGWRQWVAAAPGRSWYDAGVEFRRRMVERGYDVRAGDTWAINEVPSTTRSSSETRANIRLAVRGLYEGPDGAPHVRGAVFAEGMGSTLANTAEYRSNLSDFLSDSSFWTQMGLHVRWWAQEVYAAPSTMCVPGASTGEQAHEMNAYAEHLVRMAVAGGAPTDAAQSFLNRAYVPMLNAAYRASGYDTAAMTLDQMKRFVSTQVYATRAWSSDHQYPGRRAGFAWVWNRDEVGAPALGELAQRLASAVHYAYDAGGGAAAGACSPSRAYTWCSCSVAGASFNHAWDAFGSW